MAVLVGKEDPLGRDRRAEADRGKACAGKSTLNRLELSSVTQDKYRKTPVDEAAVEAFLVEQFIRVRGGKPKELVLDLDATDDPLHGEQEGRFYHGYYRCYCYLPLYVFCEGYVLGAKLRVSNLDGSEGAVQEMERIVGQLRAKWPKVRITLRADSSFAREALMKWCEEHRVDYVFGLARNQRLEGALESELEQAQVLQQASGSSARVYKDFRYQTRKSWSQERASGGQGRVHGGKPVFQTHLSRLSYRWLGFPVCLRSAELLKLGQGLSIERLVRITLAQRQAQPPDTDPNLPPNLQQFEADRLALRLRPRGPLQSDTPQRVQQVIGHRGEPQPQLIALDEVRRGPIGKQLQLLFLDPILRLPSRAIQLLVQLLGGPPLRSQRGDDKAAAGVVQPAPHQSRQPSPIQARQRPLQAHHVCHRGSQAPPRFQPAPDPGLGVHRSSTDREP